jgi:hypothetical protein
MVLLKKPYISKICEIEGFTVWKVDGFYVRSEIDEEFTNFGQHYRFKFIPKNEFWIDNEHSPDEVHHYVTHLLVENRLMASKISYCKALEKADLREVLERKKSAFYKDTLGVKRTSPQELIDKIHKQLLKSYSEDVKVWVVSGELVRDLFFIDFTEGGHDIVYNFVPKNEIWLDDDLSQRERKFVLLHEACERNLMLKGTDYSHAHMAASSKEHYCRMHPEEIDEKLNEELKKTV